jgi:transcriptional regulator with XRE-family HTH domain
MTRKVHYATPPAEDADLVGAPEEVTKQEFGKRVYRLMLEKGWKQSELARRAGLGRDSISTYIRGLVFPDPVNLEKLAKALGVGPGDLLPGGGVERAMERDDPALELKAARGEPGKMWVRVNQALPAEIAVQVVSLIASANANKH